MVPTIFKIRSSIIIITVHKVVQKKTSSKENYKTYGQEEKQAGLY